MHEYLNKTRLKQLSQKRVSKLEALARKRAYSEVTDPRRVGGSIHTNCTDLPIEEEDPHAPLKSREQRWEECLGKVTRMVRADELTINETMPYRIRVAWRLVREVAKLRSLLGDGDTLADALVPTGKFEDPWIQWRDLLFPLDGRANRNARAAWTVRDLVELAKHTNERPDAAGLLPPATPAGMPLKEDKVLKAWCSVMTSVGHYLGVERGTERCPELGQAGFWPLVDWQLAQSVWPTRGQIVFWEELVIRETLDLIVEGSVPEARRELFRRHGLDPAETHSMVKLALALAREEAQMDTEDQRALITLRLEEFIRRSRESADLRAELAGMKNLAVIHGLGKTDPEDTMQVFTSLARQMDDEDRIGHKPAIRGRLT